MYSRSLHFYTVLVISLLLVLGMGSCKNMKKFKADRAELLAVKKERKKNRKEKKKDKSEEIESAVEEPVIEEVEVVEEQPQTKAAGDSLYLSYERTACYGRCPIYKINIYDGGYATYDGINFVDKMGKFHGYFAESTLIDLEKTLNDMYFFQLEDAYDNPSLSDLPSKIIVVNTPVREKRITARYNVPQELIQLFEKIDGIIDANEWLPGMVE